MNVARKRWCTISHFNSTFEIVAILPTFQNVCVWTEPQATLWASGNPQFCFLGLVMFCLLYCSNLLDCFGCREGETSCVSQWTRNSIFVLAKYFLGIHWETRVPLFHVYDHALGTDLLKNMLSGRSLVAYIFFFSFCMQQYITHRFRLPMSLNGLLKKYLFSASTRILFFMYV